MLDPTSVVAGSSRSNVYVYENKYHEYVSDELGNLGLDNIDNEIPHKCENFIGEF